MANKTEEARVEVILNGQKANATLNEMRAGARALNAELGKIPDPLNSSEFAAGHKKLDDLKGKIGEVTGKANETGTSFKGMAKELVGAAIAYTALFEAGKKVFSFLTDSVKIAMEDERAQIRLTFALNGSTEAAKRMTEFTKKSYRGSMFTKDEIEAAVNMGLELGRTEAQTRKMVETAMALSRVTGKDLNTEMIALNGTYAGQTKGLGKLTGEVIGLTDEQYANGVAIDLLNTKYVKFANEGLSSTEGQLKKASDAWRELKENIGKVFAPGIGRAAQTLNATIFGDLQAKIAELKSFIAYEEDLLKRKGSAYVDTDNLAKDKEKLASLEHVLKLEQGIAQAKADSADRDQKNKDAAAKTGKWTDPGKNEPTMAEYDKTQKELAHKAEEYSNKLLDIRKKLEEATIQLIQDERDKELKMLELDFIRNLNEIKGNTEEENQLREDLVDQANKKAEAINAKYDRKTIEDAFKTEKEKWDAIIKADDDGSAEWFLDTKTLLEKQRDFELSNLKLTEEQKLDIRKKYKALTDALEGKFTSGGDKTDTTYKEPTGTMSSRSGADKLGTFNMDAKRKLLAAQRDAEINSAKDSKEAQAKIWKDFYDSLDAERRKEIESLAALANEAINVLSTIFSAQNAYEDQALQKDDDANKKKKDNLKTQLDNKQISQKQYDASILRMDNESDAKHKEIAHKQAVRQKELAVFNATIALLQAIIMAANIAPPADIVFPIIIAALMGIQLAALIATPVPAAAKGRYDVIGQDDGKNYSADWGGKAKTGIYSQPTLVAEAGPELIVDAATTKNLQMNFPWVLGAINNARVPQFAGGNYPDASTSGLGGTKMVYMSDPKTTAILEKLSLQLENPIQAFMSFDHSKETTNKVNQIESDVSK